MSVVLAVVAPGRAAAVPPTDTPPVAAPSHPEPPRLPPDESPPAQGTTAPSPSPQVPASPGPARPPLRPPPGTGAAATAPVQPPTEPGPVDPAAPAPTPPPVQAANRPPDAFDLPWASMDERPRDRWFSRGTAMLLTGSLIGGTWLLARDIVYVMMIPDLRAAAKANPDDPLSSAGGFAAVSAMIIAPTQVLLAIPGALVSAGAHQRGLWAGSYLAERLPARAVMRRHATIGWSLVGVGAALFVGQFVVTVVGGIDGGEVTPPYAAAHIGLSLAATATTISGLALGPYASGVLHAPRRHAQLSFAPTITRRGLSFTLGGRF